MDIDVKPIMKKIFLKLKKGPLYRLITTNRPFSVSHIFTTYDIAKS